MRRLGWQPFAADSPGFRGDVGEKGTFALLAPRLDEATRPECRVEDRRRLAGPPTLDLHPA